MAVTVLDDWSFVADDDPNLQSTGTLSSGSNRVLVMAYCSPNHGIDAFGWSASSVTYGNEAATATYKFGDGTDDAPRFFALWNDAAIASATDQQFRWTATTIQTEFFGWAVYEGVQQSGLDSLTNDATNNSGDTGGTTDLTTTSSSGERIIVIGGTNSAAREVTDQDTLTAKYNQDSANGFAEYHLSEGNGGDNTTTMTYQQFARPNFASIVLPESSGAGIVAQAMYHYRNHGKI